LETWDAAGFEGLYRLRLTVMRHDGGTQINEAPIVVDNTAPKVKVVHPTEGKVYVMEDEEFVSITAEAEDTWAMGKVEFYLDDKKLGESTVAPYSLRWNITMGGAMTETHRIKVKAFDRAGNEVESPVVQFKVMHKIKQPKPTGALLPGIPEPDRLLRRREPAA
jgi:hypothetical protein